MNNPIMGLAQMAMNRISSDPNLQKNPQARAFMDIMQRGDVAQVRYDMATDACAIKTAINDMGQQIMQNDNANFRALSDRLTQQEIDRLKAQLAEKDLLINQLNLGISQRNQTENIVSQLKTATCCGSCN